jgi:myo-inositol-1(or 4)-monophosphatase
MNDRDEREIIERIHEALNAAASALAPFTAGAIEPEYKSAGDPVTEADRAVNAALHKILLRPGEGWLSEESADDRLRLSSNHVWIVDPLDGTREFVAGIPEWCVSIGWALSGRATAGGILNPATGETFMGSLRTGFTYNGKTAETTQTGSLEGALILASRSEVNRGEWDRFKGNSFSIQPMGSVAYKLARVAAGMADATWTLTPKHEWDVAAGVALVEAAHGETSDIHNERLTFNNPSPLIPGLLACGPHLGRQIADVIAPHVSAKQPL